MNNPAFQRYCKRMRLAPSSGLYDWWLKARAWDKRCWEFD